MVSQPAAGSRGSFASANGRRRAAAFLIALGPELAADIMRTLPEEDISRLTWEIVGIGSLTQDEREDIMSTFYETLVGRDFVSVGGLAYAQDMLERAMGKERADEIVTKLSAHTGARPFQFLQQVDPKDLVNFIQSEHPQVVALILAYLPTDFASALLQRLPEDTQAEVAVRLAMMERTSPEVLEDIESAMRARLGLPVHGFHRHLIGAVCPCRGGVHDRLSGGDEWSERAAGGARSLLVATQGRGGAEAAARRGARRALARARGDRSDAGAVA